MMRWTDESLSRPCCRGVSLFLALALAVSPLAAQAPAPLRVTLDEVPDIRFTASPWDEKRVPVQLTLKTDGGPLKLDPPVVLLTHRVEDGTSYQVAIDVVVDDEALQVDGSRQLDLTLVGFPDAGRYEGQLRLAAPGRETVERPIRLTIREPWWLALLVILAGVLGSVILRGYMSRRSRLVLQSRALTLEEALKELDAPDDGSREVIEHLCRQLRDVAANCPPTGALTIRRINAQAGLLTTGREVHRRLSALDPEARKEFQEQLDGADELLDSEAEVQEVEAARNRLQQALRRITRKWQEALTGKVTALHAKLDQCRRMTESESFPPDREDEVRARFEGLRARLREIRGESRLDKAEEIYEEVARDVEAFQGELSRPATRTMRGARDESLPASFSLSADGGSAEPMMNAVASTFGFASAGSFQLPRLEDVRRTMVWGDTLVTLSVFTMAGILGIDALWANNPVWGSWNDYLIAFGWGLGLHVVSFDSLTQRLNATVSGKQQGS